MRWPVEALLGGAIVTVGVAPVVKGVMIRVGVIDVPNHRSSHVLPTPRGGGVACVLGVAAAALAAQLAGRDLSWPVICGAVLLAAVGFIDDRQSMPAATRLTAQVVAGAAVGSLLGGPRLGLLGMVTFPLLVNAVNFMDGINGITSIVLSVWGVTAFAVGLQDGSPALALVGVITLAISVGFLPWNLPRAQLFLGDVGSYLFGALAAGGLLLGAHAGVSTATLVAPLLLYLADVFVTLARRALRGRALTQAHREHTYQRLTGEIGWSHGSTALLVGGLSAGLVVVWHFAPRPIASVVTVAVVLLYLALPSHLESKPV